MAYEVINKFIDSEDNNTLYNVGDKYPKGDFKPTKKRIDELSKVHPKYKVAFVKEKEQPKDKKKSTKE
ncbi:hypothetical protein [Psychrobacillus sp. FSL H8-0487]|uniref:hypothetical protein n=1 Tax=Psychrobacillus sp. FSL H8-0487 TaxID=2921391 RepID=UPI0030F87C3F